MHIKKNVWVSGAPIKILLQILCKKVQKLVRKEVIEAHCVLPYVIQMNYILKLIDLFQWLRV